MYLETPITQAAPITWPSKTTRARASRLRGETTGRMSQRTRIKHLAQHACFKANTAFENECQLKPTPHTPEECHPNFESTTKSRDTNLKTGRVWKMLAGTSLSAEELRILPDHTGGWSEGDPGGTSPKPASQATEQSGHNHPARFLPVAFAALGRPLKLSPQCVN